MKRPPKALLERAVKATQLYCGSEGARIRDQQKLYNQKERVVDRVAAVSGMDRIVVSEQIDAEARRRGCITPLPGHHI